jgi:hypothetical protein
MQPDEDAGKSGKSLGGQEGNNNNDGSSPPGKPGEKAADLVQYIDDAKDYKIRIKPKERHAYFKFLKEHKRKDNFKEETFHDDDLIEKTFPLHMGRIFTVISTKAHDFIYLICFFIVITVNALSFDRTLPDSIASYIDEITTGLLFLAAATQAVQILGMIYFMNWHNVRAQYRAETQINDWVSTRNLRSHALYAFKFYRVICL